MQKTQESLVNTSIYKTDILELYNQGLVLITQLTNIFCYRYRIIDKQELISHLTEKLVLIIKKYDASRGINFKYFAIPSLRGYAWNYIRDHGRTVKVPRKYSELYLKYNSLNRKNNYKLSIEEASQLMNIEPGLLRTALEATSLKFSEISSYNSSLLCNKSTDMAISFLQLLPKGIYELLEEIFIDGVQEEKAFLSRGLTPQQGRELLKPYLKEIFKLKDF